MTEAQQLLKAAQNEAEQLLSERLTMVEPTSTLEQLIADQGESLRRTLIACTAALVASIEAR